MKHKKIVFLVSIFFLSGIVASAQDSYKITVRTNGFKDTVCYLGYYMGKFQYAKDTTQFDNKGVAVFENKSSALERGVYFIVFPNKKYLDFVINKEQNLSFDIDTSDIAGKAKVSGSRENQLFYDYNRSISKIGVEYERLRLLKEQYETSEHDSLPIIQAEMKKLNDEMLKIKEDFIRNNPETFVAKIFRLTTDPVLPEAPVKEDGTKDSLYLYTFFKEHYWENMDFTDGSLVRTPVFHGRLERFITQVVIQHPDSVIKELDLLIKKTENAPDLFKYVVWYLTFHYETSQIMGHDAVFVHLVDKYYRSGKAFWVSEASLQKILQRADKLSPILIGKIAPNMALLDTSLKAYTQLWAIKAKYTVMIFWDPGCGHCKKEIEHINTFWKENGSKYDIKIYSVCTDTNLTSWKKLIEEKQIDDWINVNGTRSALGNYHELYDVFSTPLIFILDEEKKIIAKKLSAEATTSFIPKWDATRNKENMFNIETE